MFKMPRAFLITKRSQSHDVIGVPRDVSAANSFAVERLSPPEGIAVRACDVIANDDTSNQQQHEYQVAVDSDVTAELQIPSFDDVTTPSAGD